MNFEERQRLRSARSAVQLEREHRIRRMHVRTLYGTKLYLGGGTSAHPNRGGYPASKPDRNLTAS